jgi:hypothetical protein
MLLDMLKERMSFLEDLSYDKHFYHKFQSTKDKNLEYEIYLKRDKKWVVREFSSDVPVDKYPGMNIQQVLSNLECLGINEEELFEAISYHCLIQVAYADLVVQKATELFGISAIENARKAQQEFNASLVEAIKKITNPIKSIEGDGQSTPKKTGHLKVIK